jgi:hypothetical protein
MKYRKPAWGTIKSKEWIENQINDKFKYSLHGRFDYDNASYSNMTMMNLTVIKHIEIIADYLIGEKMFVDKDLMAGHMKTDWLYSQSEGFMWAQYLMQINGLKFDCGLKACSSTLNSGRW